MLDSENAHLLPPGLTLAWGVTPASRRGPKPAHSIGQIVEAAVELADDDGLAAASMPNIAAQLGFTTNALYRYVSSKEELTVLLADAGWGPPPGDLVRDGDWRATAKAWAQAAIDRYRTRTWLLDIPLRGAPVTPNLLRWMEILLQALAGTGLAHGELFGSALLLDGFARSAAARARGQTEGHITAERTAAMQAFLEPLLKGGGYPLVASMMSDGRFWEVSEVDFGLDRLLDGIEAHSSTHSDDSQSCTA
ncbi:AcrR family transcriptional regulator [Kibdelosporangium banguiense]|uniref:AcrR family transcriptional regulator n=1 Tax=Kibdelosporangium banguiense TaxID=1365924 RepID=A0ABS4TRU7_9PSEU|nr:TetR/AcrR family transcriptional regulator [Kibdelosporangium banguiense]MBP2327127.1 AcrR family transcriptional regulator [Kibdelosporangium banguiense]